MAAGLAALASGTPLYDSGIAIGIAMFIVVMTLKAVLGLEKEPVWPENGVDGPHDEPINGA